MPTEVVHAEWVRGNVFLLRDHGGFPIVMTQPNGALGADLLPLSLIGCAAWDVVEVLRKQRAPLKALAVTGSYERAPETPRRFQAVHIHYRFTGRLDPTHVRRAIELTENKYCSIHATLREAVALSSDFEISEAEIGDGSSGNLQAPIADHPSPATASATSVVLAFNDALNAGDVDAMMSRLTPDCVFENTFPAPDGTRYEGQAAVRVFWEEFFRASRQPRLEYEEVFECGERAVLRWTYHWLDERGQPGHVRGVDVYRVRVGLIAEKLSYVKG
jgi:uncharacterized OsmC-like protein